MTDLVSRGMSAFRWQLARTVELTKFADCPSGLLVEGTYDDTPFKPIVLRDKTASIGLDGVRVFLESEIAQQIADALREVG